MPVGDAALVRVRAWNGEAVGEEVDLLLNQKRCQATGRDLFTAHGLVLEDKRIVVVKSSQHFHAAYAPIAQDVLYVGSPGAIASDLTTLTYRTSEERRVGKECVCTGRTRGWPYQ